MVLMKKERISSGKNGPAVGILLGGGVYEDRSLPEDARRRAEKAFDLLEEGSINKLILSGKGQHQKPGNEEAEAFKGYLAKKGVKKDGLILEKESNDTIGNAVYSKKIFLKNRFPKDVIVITSDYHMERALRIFRHIFGKGYNISGVSSKSPLFQRPIFKKREWEHMEIEKLLLLEVPEGDHIKAEELIKKYLPQYT